MNNRSPAKNTAFSLVCTIKFCRHRIHSNTKLNKSQVQKAKKEDEMKKFYICEEVAEMYRVKVSTVWAWVRAGKLKAVCVGKQYRITKEALAEFEKSK